MSVDSHLNPEVVRAESQPSDHYPVFSHLSISPDPPPQTRTFRHLHSIDHTASQHWFTDSLRTARRECRHSFILRLCGI